MNNDQTNSKILQDLGERVKELGALHRTARILQDGSKPVSELINAIGDLLPAAWQYPEITVVRIQYGNISFTTDNFRETPWCQKAGFTLRSGESGAISVYYLQQMPQIFEGPFLAEERELINSLAEMLRLYLQQKVDEQALQKAHDNLELLVRERTGELSKSNRALAEEIAEHKKAERQIASYQKQLQKMASELSITEARERRVIAEELHDYIGQSLAFMKMKLSALKKDMKLPANISLIEEMDDILGKTIQYTRDLTLQISPPVLYELGLSAAIEWLAEQYLKNHNLDIKVIIKNDHVPLREEVKVVLFKSVNELLNNVVKHAATADVILRVEADEHSVRIDVEDNGAGFDPESLDSGQSGEWGFGLFSIRERLKYLGGYFDIQSAPGRGTRARLSAPRKI
jgi:signal transduction histidine kinase